MNNEWVEIFFTYDSLEAEMIKDILRSGGIEVASFSNKLSPYPVNIGKIGEIRLYVKKEYASVAKEIILSPPSEYTNA